VGIYEEFPALDDALEWRKTAAGKYFVGIPQFGPQNQAMTQETMFSDTWESNERHQT
jgi:hypothetical protein